MTVHPCPGPRCDDGNGDPLLTAQPFCDPCTRRVAAALAALPRDYVELLTALIPSQGAGEHVTGSREAPLPLRADVLSLAEDIAGCLCDYEDVTRRAHGFTPAGRQLRYSVTVDAEPVYDGPDRGAAEHAAVEAGPGAVLSTWPAHEPLRRDAVHQPAEGKQLAAAARFLTFALSKVLGGPAGVDTGLEMLDLHRRARVMLGLVSGDRALPVPCPHDDCRHVGSLVLRNGESHVECDRRRGGCGKAFDLRRLLRWVAVDKSDLLLPAAQAARLVGVDRSTVSRWVTAGLVPTVADGAGGVRVRVGDVLDVAANRATGRMGA